MIVVRVYGFDSAPVRLLGLEGDVERFSLDLSTSMAAGATWCVSA